MRLAYRMDLAAYAAAKLTYPEHGATRDGALPPGYRHVVRRERIGAGEATFNAAGAALFSWRMHRGAGLVVLGETMPATTGAVVVMRLGPPVVGFVVPCRVVYTVDEPGRRGFAYGTLPGHPASGEEAFVVELGGDGGVDLVVRAFSRPETRLARLGGPVTRATQRLMTDRYVRSMRRLARP